MFPGICGGTLIPPRRLDSYEDEEDPYDDDDFSDCARARRMHLTRNQVATARRPRRSPKMSPMVSFGFIAAVVRHT